MCRIKISTWFIITLFAIPLMSVDQSLQRVNICGKGDINKPLHLRGVGLHDVGILTLLIDDVGGAEGWRYTYLWPDSLGIEHLYWNWLAVGYSNYNVSDGWDTNWVTTSGGQIVITEPGIVSDEDGYAQYYDTPNYIEVTQESYAWANHPHNDYVIFKYSIKNIGSSSISPVYVGHRSDFDVMGDHYGAPTDLSDFDATRNLAYMWDTSSSWHVGVKILEGTFRGYHQGWYSDSDSAKFYALSTAGADPPTPFADDWCFWLSVGPYNILPNGSVIVAFAFLSGEDLADLQANADTSQAKWNSLGVNERKNSGILPISYYLNVYPNPFYSKTNIEHRISNKNVSLHIYSATGQLVKSFNNPPSKLIWNGTDDSGKKLPGGVYFLKLKAGKLKETRKILMIK